jgi:hypothetical protein
MVMALRTTFRPEAAARKSVRYELRMGPVVIHALVKNATVNVGKGSIDNPDLIVEAGPGLRAIMAQEISPAKALEAGLARITGDPKLFELFAKMFRI